MPNRIIKNSICKSESIRQLTWFEEVFFYRLIVNCDDYGRADARLDALASDLFPVRRDITLKQVEAALNKLVTVGMVRVYTYDRQQYLQLLAWEKHQQIRNHKSKYPPPPEEEKLKSIDINCNQMISNVTVLDSDKDSISTPLVPSFGSLEKRKRDCKGEGEKQSLFEEFWSAYPKKRSKGDAQKAWEQINPDESLFAKIMSSVFIAKESSDWRKENGKYIPYPATWIRRQGWEDDFSVSVAPKSNNPFLELLKKQEGKEREFDGIYEDIGSFT